VSVEELIAMMVDTDLEEARRDAHLVEGGFPVRNPGE
jgi:hypothetical protein